MKIVKRNFDLKQIAESGQAFRWHTFKEGYILIAHHECIYIREEDDSIIIDSDSEHWLNYFDLNRDYQKIIDHYANKDDYLKKATDFGSGIRVLRQDPFEMIITFIISANNNIKRITESIKQLSSRYGSYLRSFDGVDYYDFPTIEQFKKLTIEDFRNCGVGYRDKYLYELVQTISIEDVYDWQALDDLELKAALLRLKGVGEKVANCILLFGYHRVEGFPIDTWIKKVLLEAYGVENNQQAFAEDYFKPYGGIAQQYLFYYGRLK